MTPLRNVVAWMARSSLRAFVIIFLLSFSLRVFFLAQVPQRFILPNDRMEDTAIATSLVERGEFADPSHPWSHDLDIFGRGSLYQYLNRTSTFHGAGLLAGFLTTEPENPEEIVERQGIIGDLMERIGFRQTFTARGTMIKEGR